MRRGGAKGGPALVRAASLLAPHATFQRPQIVSALLLPFAAPTSRQVAPAPELPENGHGGYASLEAPFARDLGSNNVGPDAPVKGGSLRGLASGAHGRVSLEGGGGKRGLHRQASVLAEWLHEDAAGIAG